MNARLDETCREAAGEGAMQALPPLVIQHLLHTRGSRSVGLDGGENTAWK
jgi:hypothetical protein